MNIEGVVACILLWALLAAPIAPAAGADLCAKGGIGSGVAPLASGDGGPSVPGPDPVGGMGGSGISAALGEGEEAVVLGTITRFGSVCVNGEHVRFAPDVPIEVDGVPDDARALRLGQVVRLQVRRGAEGAPVARRIDVLNAVAGPVTARDEATGRFTVMGRQVLLGPDTMIDHAGPAVPELGARVIASGLADTDGRLVVTRVQAAWPGSPALVAGMVTELDGDMLEVEGVPIRFDGAEAMPGLARGVEVAVRGGWTGEHLDADALVLQPGLSLDWMPARVSVEGYLDRCGAGSTFALGGLAVQLPPGLDPTAWVGRRVIGVGRAGAAAGVVLTALRASPLGQPGDDLPAAPAGRPPRVCVPLSAPDHGTP